MPRHLELHSFVHKQYGIDGQGIKEKENKALDAVSCLNIIKLIYDSQLPRERDRYTKLLMQARQDNAIRISLR